MPVVRCWPEVSVKHQHRQLVVDATTSDDKTAMRGPEYVARVRVEYVYVSLVS